MCSSRSYHRPINTISTAGNNAVKRKIKTKLLKIEDLKGRTYNQNRSTELNVCIAKKR